MQLPNIATNRIRVPVSVIPINDLLPQALDKTLSILGEGPKKAVLFTLEEKYGLLIKSRMLMLDSVRDAIIDLFGPDGSRLILERLWLELEELADNKTKIQTPQPKQIAKKLSPDEKFNNHVSGVFADFITEMLGADVYTWIESKLRMQNTTLKNAYLDANKIAPVLWESFSTAGGFLLNNMIRQLAITLGIQPSAYEQTASLKALLDEMKSRSGFS